LPPLGLGCSQFKADLSGSTKVISVGPMLRNLPVYDPKEMHVLGCVLSPGRLDVGEDSTVHSDLSSMYPLASGPDGNPFSLGDHLVDEVSLLEQVQARIHRFHCIRSTFFPWLYESVPQSPAAPLASPALRSSNWRRTICLFCSGVILMPTGAETLENSSTFRERVCGPGI